MKQEFQQGSEEWLAFRRTKRNASETPMIMKESPFGGWQTVKDSKEGKGFKGNVATNHGQKHEETARQKFEEVFGLIGNPTVIVDGDYSASLDWLSHDEKTIAEFKVPYQGKNSKLWKAMEKADGLYYYWQVQHQLMVTPTAEVAILFVLDAESGDYLSLEIFPNKQAQEKIRKAWDEWLAWSLTDTPEPDDSRNRTDTAWNEAAAAYIAAKKAADKAAEELEACRVSLVGLAESDKEKGCGVVVTKTERKGAVDYAKVPELKGIDLEPYRKKSSQVTTVSLEK